MPPLSSTEGAAKVLIVDDHPALREALAMRIGQSDDMEVCGEAADVADALKMVSEHNPDLAVIDISLRTGDGLDLVKRIKAKNPSVRILVWSMHDEDLYAERVLRAGAHGYMSKDQATDQIIEALRHVFAGKVYLSPEMNEKLLHRVVGDRAESLNHSPVDVLSDREMEVLRMIGEGLKTAAIAERLHLSVKTVETYRDRIRKKLGLSDGTSLICYAAKWVVANQ